MRDTESISVIFRHSNRAFLEVSVVDDDLHDLKKRRLEMALQLRNFEIELFWKRFNYFWLISAAALVGYASVKERSDKVLMLIACFGLVSSFSWTLLNIGSKWWQEAYEEKVKKYERSLGRGFFTIHNVPRSRLFLFRLRRFSVSSIAVGISSFSTAFWFGVATWHLLKLSSKILNCQIVVDVWSVVSYLVSIAFCVVTFVKSHRRT